MGGGVTTFIALRVGVNASRVPPKERALWAGRTVRKTMVFAPIDASRGDDERVFDYLHRAGIDIKLVGNPTNGFSSL